MTVLNEKFIITSYGSNSLIDITDKIKGFVHDCKSKNAVVNVFTKSPYASVITLDYKKISSEDFLSYIKNLIPINWKQDDTTNSNIAFMHTRASLLGNNVAFAITDGDLEILDEQKIVIVDFNISPSEIEIIASLIT